MAAFPIPDDIHTTDELDDFLAQPYPETIEMMARAGGEWLILGAGGKMGGSLARLAARAAREAGVEPRITAVSRFSDDRARAELDRAGIETIACDLLDPRAVSALPRRRNAIFMAGRKFGEQGSEDLTWMTNVAAAADAARHCVESGSRVVAFSTGCVYPLVGAASGGCTEDEAPAPVGEYAASCLGRERVFEYFARRHGVPSLLFRLNYAIDLRYGVLVDIAQRVRSGEPVNLAAAHVNIIWQGDANNRALLAIERAAVPAVPLNVTGPELLSVAMLAERFGGIFGAEVRFTGADSGKAYLSNAARSIGWFGPPRVSVERMIAWTAAWLCAGGGTLDKPTHFEVTDGQFLDPSRKENPA